MSQSTADDGVKTANDRKNVESDDAVTDLVYKLIDNE